MHRVPAEVPGYALVADKKGTRLSPAAGPVREGNQKFPDGGTMMIRTAVNGDQEAAFSHASMASLIAIPQLTARIPIQDRTGLTGTFDFVLPRTIYRNSDGEDVTGSAHMVPWDVESLGLKLVPVKVPTETIVIDRIDKPSPN